MTRGPKPRPIQVPLFERPRLLDLAAKQRVAHVLVQHAKMILRLAKGLGPTAVARRLGCSDRNARKRRARWEARPEVEALHDGDRAGRLAPVQPRGRRPWCPASAPRSHTRSALRGPPTIAPPWTHRTATASTLGPAPTITAAATIDPDGNLAQVHSPAAGEHGVPPCELQQPALATGVTAATSTSRCARPAGAR